MTPTIIGNATLYLGDCLEILPDVRKQAAYILSFGVSQTVSHASCGVNLPAVRVSASAGK